MAASREKRQLKILELIEHHNIETQEDLTALLNDNGYKATQATVSRDIKDMGLIKVMADGKSYKYIVSNNSVRIDDKFKKIFKESTISIASSLNIIVIKTVSGSANAAAFFIDKLKHKEIIGTVAGDDTVVMVIDKVENVSILVDTLKSYLN